MAALASSFLSDILSAHLTTADITYRRLLGFQPLGWDEYQQSFALHHFTFESY